MSFGYLPARDLTPIQLEEQCLRLLIAAAGRFDFRKVPLLAGPFTMLSASKSEMLQWRNARRQLVGDDRLIADFVTAQEAAVADVSVTHPLKHMTRAEKIKALADEWLAVTKLINEYANVDERTLFRKTATFESLATNSIWLTRVPLEFRVLCPAPMLGLYGPANYFVPPVPFPRANIPLWTFYCAQLARVCVERPVSRRRWEIWQAHRTEAQGAIRQLAEAVHETWKDYAIGQTWLFVLGSFADLYPDLFFEKIRRFTSGVASERLCREAVQIVKSVPRPHRHELTLEFYEATVEKVKEKMQQLYRAKLQLLWINMSELQASQDITRLALSVPRFVEQELKKLRQTARDIRGLEEALQKAVKIPARAVCFDPLNENLALQGLMKAVKACWLVSVNLHRNAALAQHRDMVNPETSLHIMQRSARDMGRLLGTLETYVSSALNMALHSLEDDVRAYHDGLQACVAQLDTVSREEEEKEGEGYPLEQVWSQPDIARTRLDPHQMTILSSLLNKLPRVRELATGFETDEQLRAFYLSIQTQHDLYLKLPSLLTLVVHAEYPLPFVEPVDPDANLFE